MSGSSQLTDFTNALQTSADDYGVELDSDSLAGLSRYYEFLNAWNARLHLVAPTSPQEFATRHILESLMLVHYLDEGSRVADLGSGGGLPILPCLIVRRDIRATLIDSSQKKGVFLREALTHTKVSDRATVIIDRFEDIAAPQVEFVTCRAIERFERLLPHLIEWAPSSATLLLFGGEGLETQIAKTGLIINTDLLPNSARRFLFVVRKRQG
jgi:16S rRNA (guanine527-N7)-methyltransferase